MLKIGRYLGRYFGLRNKMLVVVLLIMINFEFIVEKFKKIVRI